MKFAISFLYIMAFWALGTGVSFLTGGVVPGGVLGMVFLFLALLFGFIKEGRVELASKWLLKYMVLFFLPAAVGVMVAWETIGSNVWAIGLAVMVSSVLVIGVVGLLQQKLGKRW